jgi:hypothetical protein
MHTKRAGETEGRHTLPPLGDADEDQSGGGEGGAYLRKRVHACTRGEKMLPRERGAREPKISKNSVGCAGCAGCVGETSLVSTLPTQDLRAERHRTPLIPTLP